MEPFLPPFPLAGCCSPSVIPFERRAAFTLTQSLFPHRFPHWLFPSASSQVVPDASPANSMTMLGCSLASVDPTDGCWEEQGLQERSTCPTRHLPGHGRQRWQEPEPHQTTFTPLLVSLCQQKRNPAKRGRGGHYLVSMARVDKPPRPRSLH